MPTAAKIRFPYRTIEDPGVQRNFEYLEAVPVPGLAAGAAPGGPAGGDLAGSYPNPTLANTPQARADLGLGSAAVQPATAFALATAVQPTVGRPYGISRAGAQYGLAVGWQGISWDTYDLDGSNAENLWQNPAVWVTNAAGLWEYALVAIVTNSTGVLLDCAVGYNSGNILGRQQVQNSYQGAVSGIKTLSLGAGVTITPTVYVNSAAGGGAQLQPGSYTRFRRVG